VRTDPVLKFFVASVTFYGMATFEGPLMSIRSVNALSHYTDWGVAHVHGGGLGCAIRGCGRGHLWSVEASAAAPGSDGA
jgi:cbb3-type cytochrome oxidase subunit 1